MNANSLFAPIALFTLKRPENRRRTLESLARNAEFLDSPLFIYCDGERHEGKVAQAADSATQMLINILNKIKCHAETLGIIRIVP